MIYKALNLLLLTIMGFLLYEIHLNWLIIALLYVANQLVMEKYRLSKQEELEAFIKEKLKGFDDDNSD